MERTPIIPLRTTASLADEPPPFRLGYRRWLDGLRGAAILFVLAFHFQLLRGGSLGVDIFFVLSGFLITTLLVEEKQRTGSIRLPLFYGRRFLRLFPALAVLLAAFAVHTLITSPPEKLGDRWQELIVAGLYLTNCPDLTGTNFTLLGHTWSLSVEEQFYLIWPALLCLLFRFQASRRHIVTFVAVGIVASCALRLGLHRQHLIFGGESIDTNRLYNGLDTRADALLAGCLASLLITWNYLPTAGRFITWLKPASVLAAVGLAYALYRWDMGSAQYYDGMFTVVAICSATVLIRLVLAPSRWALAILEWRPLVAVGQVSYGLYLFHQPIIWVVKDIDAWPMPVRVVVALTATIAMTLLSYFLVERPCLRLKDRWLSPAKTQVAAPVTSAPARAA